MFNLAKLAKIMEQVKTKSNEGYTSWGLPFIVNYNVEVLPEISMKVLVISKSLTWLRQAPVWAPAAIVVKTAFTETLIHVAPCLAVVGTGLVIGDSAYNGKMVSYWESGIAQR